MTEEERFVKTWQTRENSKLERQRIVQERERQDALWNELTQEQTQDIIDWVLTHRAIAKDYPRIFASLCYAEADRRFVLKQEVADGENILAFRKGMGISP